jgi:hypothetical protein
MNFTAEQIQENWDELMEYINEYISEPRKEKLLAFYKKYADRLILMPAAHKKEYHNAFPGGYVEHVLRVIRCAIKQATLWEEEGCDMSTFTIEELVFSALNHDLGKMGDEEQESYIPQTDNWRHMPEQKPRTSLPFILHQADLMAARIEFEREWLPKLKEGKKPVDAGKGNYTLGNKPNMSKKTSTKTKALGTFKSEGLKNIFDQL